MFSQDEKRLLEHEAARLFMRAYEAETGDPMRHIWHNEPRKPDVSCYVKKEHLDLEIAHLYGSEEEARLILGRAISPQTLKALRALMAIPPECRLVAALNEILRNKASKYYDSPRVWLVIRNANPLWSADDISACRNRIAVPKQHPFDQIWVLGDWHGQTGIVPLYP